MKQRFILHSDLNNFFASVEMLSNPKWKNYALLVVGNSELRHGIVLAKNNFAKSCGVKTGETIYQAKLKCEGLPIKLIKTNIHKYAKYSILVKNIYKEYSDNVESFGIDEAWLDISKTANSWDDAYEIAEILRKEVKQKTGLTVSIGVSYNKIFAKLGSDLKKPDAVTVITPENFKQVVWKLPKENLLFVGRKTKEKLEKYSIKTIGDLANCNVEFLRNLLGKMGETLWTFANGLDNSPVSVVNSIHQYKSIGNSVTCPYDLTEISEVETIFYILAESVASRLKNHGLWASTVQIVIKNKDFVTFDRQCKIDPPSNLSSDLALASLKLFKENYTFEKPVRLLGLQAKGLSYEQAQLSFFSIDKNYKKQCKIEETVEKIRKRYGPEKIKRGSVLKNAELANFNPHDPYTLSMEADDEFI